jgi:hypothetical protein
MPLEPNISGLWFGKQSAKATENTTPTHRAIQVGGDFNIARDDGNENWSDLTKYGGNTDWINSLVGNGNPAIEATPSETGALLWLAHGAEVATAGTNNVQTLSGNPTTGVFTLNIWDGYQTIPVTADREHGDRCGAGHVDRGGVDCCRLHRRRAGRRCGRPVEHDADHDHVQRPADRRGRSC